ncbi:hypothetical protein C6972_10235 [Escherichia coli]|nr:hypothetical protein C6972_10235 [Escherichia coli]PSG82923.1 hypothetical protein C6986_11830 [Escherichia coli]
MTSLKTSIKTITYLSDTGCLEIQGASLTSKKNTGNTTTSLGNGMLLCQELYNRSTSELSNEQLQARINCGRSVKVENGKSTFSDAANEQASKALNNAGTGNVLKRLSVNPNKRY